jgi:hypothetical protein
MDQRDERFDIAGHELRVYAIWIPMLPTDARSEWDGSIFDDPRAINLWDGDRVLGRWLGEHDEFNAGRFGPIVWDAFFVFGRDSSWQAAPSLLLGSGSPVIGETSKLNSALCEQAK